MPTANDIPTENRAKPAPLRPFDAATLLVIDRSASAPSVLMGKRHQSLAFMPGKYVFPGGRADPADRKVAAADDLIAADMEKLLLGMGARPSLTRARALGLCAIRETFEETGLRIALPASTEGKPVDHVEWNAFVSEGVLPAPGHLRYIARAITPPHRVRRFDTRFFTLFRDSLPGLETQSLVPSGELEDIQWVPIHEAYDLDLPRITQFVLKHVEDLLADGGPEFPDAIPLLQYTQRYGRLVREVI